MAIIFTAKRTIINKQRICTSNCLSFCRRFLHINTITPAPAHNHQYAHEAAKIRKGVAFSHAAGAPPAEVPRGTIIKHGFVASCVTYCPDILLNQWLPTSRRNDTTTCFPVHSPCQRWLIDDSSMNWATDRSRRGPWRQKKGKHTANSYFAIRRIACQISWKHETLQSVLINPPQIKNSRWACSPDTFFS